MGLTLFQTDAAGWLSDDRLCRVAWSRLADPGDVTAARVLESHGVREAVRLVMRRDSAGDQGLAALLRRWNARLGTLDPEQDMHNAALLGARVIIPGDDEWPTGLDLLGERAPVCLWARGPARPDWSRSVALVGSRACTQYGMEVASGLAAGLADEGVTVISGGAYGIDIAAHRGAVVAGGGTAAVLAGGLDQLYPKGNERMLNHLADNHLLLSEAPPGVTSARWRFLERNRLIAAVSAATVVIEAAWRSGALNTARHASEIGRPLGVIPGPVTSSMSTGCHRLLREQDAICVTDTAEVMELAGLGGGDPVEGPSPMDPLELRIYDALPTGRARSAAALADETGLEASQVMAVLGRLELSEVLTETGEGWRRASVGRKAHRNG